MNKNKFIYVASWKMYLSFKQAHEWVNHNHAALKTLGTDFSIIICPSFDSLSTLKHDLQGTNIALGAQNCSEYKQGPYTGQIAAESLAEIGCSYCIVGHSETRTAFYETDTAIAHKIVRLFTHHITPILYIGETAQEYDNKLTTQALERQLEPTLKLIQNEKKTIIIGYEPLWTKDNNRIPSIDYIKEQVNTIKRFVLSKASGITCKVVYGGNVNEQTIFTLKRINELDGVLVGKASTDFQSFEKIVLST